RLSLCVVVQSSSSPALRLSSFPLVSPLPFFFLILRPPPISPLFPYTTLFRSLRESSFPLHSAHRRHHLRSCSFLLQYRWPSESADEAMLFLRQFYYSGKC